MTDYAVSESILACVQ